jgi:hypothetical protein
VDLRGVVAAGAEHHRSIGKAEPVYVEPGEVVHQVSHKGVLPAGHHHAV